MDCPGRRHGTVYAYKYNGCRCPDVVARVRGYARKAKRQQPGRLLTGPRDRSQLVDVVAVERACHGDQVPLTIRERALAVEHLTAHRVPIKEIARRLGLSSRSVCRYRAGFQRFGKAA